MALHVWHSIVTEGQVSEDVGKWDSLWKDATETKIRRFLLCKREAWSLRFYPPSMDLSSKIIQKFDHELCISRWAHSFQLLFGVFTSLKAVQHLYT